MIHPPRYFSIRGMKAAPYNEETKSKKAMRKWQEHLEDELRTQPKIQDFPKPPRFAVDFIFVFTEINVKSVDLDNLAKPVLDVFFISSGYPSFFLCDANDSLVFDVRVRKVGVPVKKHEEEGVDVILTWW